MAVTKGASGDRRPFLRWLEHGQVVKGVVSDVRNFGVFVDIGGFAGMVNCAELSWAHIDHPADVVRVGDRVTVMVMDVDLDRERVSLSLKALHPDPMAEFARTRLGSTVRGEVVRIAPIGIFVAVDSGVAGLIRHDDLDQVPEVGDELAVVATEVNLVLRQVRLIPADQPST